MVGMKGSDRENRGGCAVIAGIGVALLPLLYFLSVGPAVWLANHGVLSERLVNGFYYPLESIGGWSSTFHDVLGSYLALWAW